MVKLMFSMKTVYGLKALQYLASKGAAEHTLISEIASKANIPKKFLEAILLSLKNEGILNSKIGKGGGYQLAYPASSITIASIVRALEGTLALVPCAQDNNGAKCEYCDDYDTCGVRLIMTDLTDGFENLLGAKTLADMLTDVEKAVQSRIINYTI